MPTAATFRDIRRLVIGMLALVALAYIRLALYYIKNI